MKYSIIYTTTKTKKEAKNIAIHLLNKKLVGCANIFPITSLYIWKGKIQEEKEIGMILKTETILMKKIIREIKSLHSYEIPCIVSFEIKKGNNKFLKWITENVSQV